MKKGTLSINDNIFQVDIAITSQEQQNGLMGQEYPFPIMIFPYDRLSVPKFWMKNTPSPLAIAFCKDNEIHNICYGVPNSKEILGNNDFSDLVIEFPKHYIKKYNIKIKDSFKLFKK
jgi:uncharacterized membrane protein (UPF0127 family)